MRGTLLLLEMTAVQLLLGLCLSRLLRPLAGRGSGVAMGVFTAALAAVMQMALMAWKPGWWEEMPTVLYYVLAFLSGAMSARSEEWEEHLPKFGWWAGALLLLGGLREWLAAGRLMGVRLLWDGLSKDFGLGGLGLLTAALLLSICGLKQRWSWQYSVRESAQAGGLLFLCTALAGCIAAPLYRLDLPAGIPGVSPRAPSVPDAPHRAQRQPLRISAGHAGRSGAGGCGLRRFAVPAGCHHCLVVRPADCPGRFPAGWLPGGGLRRRGQPVWTARGCPHSGKPRPYC